MRSRRLLAILVLFPPLVITAAATAAESTHPNVVVIVVDDQGLEAGCYGHPVIHTPHLDALADEGTRFEYAFCTTASCSASRSVILTGLHNHANGQFGHMHSYNNFHTFTRIRSLPVLLADAGYRTCSIGKFHVQPESIYHFQQYSNDGIQGARNPHRMGENARRFIAADDDRPFFLYLCPSDPHRSREGFGNETEHPGVEETRYDPRRVLVPDYLPDLPEVRAEIAEYYQAVSRADQALGNVVEALRQTDHLDDTYIFYLSDNGPAFPGAKTTLYDPGMRLPLVIRSPNAQARGVVSQALVSFTDLTPTILDIAGADAPDYPLHGRSMLPILESPRPNDWDEVYASHTFHEITMYYPMRVIRTRRYKYLLNLAHALPYPFASDLYRSRTWQALLATGQEMMGTRPVDAYVHRPRHELYDLTADPHEVVNLAEDPAHAEVLAELQQKLRTFQERTGDPWVLKYEYE